MKMDLTININYIAKAREEYPKVEEIANFDELL